MKKKKNTNNLPVPNIFELKFDFTVIEASTLDLPISFTMGRILKGRLMFSVVRYLYGFKIKLQMKIKAEN
jgi:hypothetical protein